MPSVHELLGFRPWPWKKQPGQPLPRVSPTHWALCGSTWGSEAPVPESAALRDARDQGLAGAHVARGPGGEVTARAPVTLARLHH